MTEMPYGMLDMNPEQLDEYTCMHRDGLKEPARSGDIAYVARQMASKGRSGKDLGRIYLFLLVKLSVMDIFEVARDYTMVAVRNALHHSLISTQTQRHERRSETQPEKASCHRGIAVFHMAAWQQV